MNGYYAAILEGAVLTVTVSLASLAVAMCLGLVGAAAKLADRALWRGLATAYTTVIRGVPDLVLMLLIYYGGTMAINAVIEAMGSDAFIDINPWWAGVLTIGFIYGAYMTETFRGAILAVPKGQIEAAWAVGMSRGQAFRRIVLPQMVRHALPGFTNNWLVLIKTTALVSLIGLHEMTYKAKQASAATREPFAYLIFAAVLFLLMTSVSLWVIQRVQKRFDRGTVAASL